MQTKPRPRKRKPQELDEIEVCYVLPHIGRFLPGKVFASLVSKFYPAEISCNTVTCGASSHNYSLWKSIE